MHHAGTTTIISRQQQHKHPAGMIRAISTCSKCCEQIMKCRDMHNTISNLILLCLLSKHMVRTSRKLKCKLVDSLVKPSLSYASEVWTADPRAGASAEKLLRYACLSSAIFSYPMQMVVVHSGLCSISPLSCCFHPGTRLHAKSITYYLALLHMLACGKLHDMPLLYACSYGNPLKPHCSNLMQACLCCSIVHSSLCQSCN